MNFCSALVSSILTRPRARPRLMPPHDAGTTFFTSYQYLSIPTRFIQSSLKGCVTNCQILRYKNPQIFRSNTCFVLLQNNIIIIPKQQAQKTVKNRVKQGSLFLNWKELKKSERKALVSQVNSWSFWESLTRRVVFLLHFLQYCLRRWRRVVTSEDGTCCSSCRNWRARRPRRQKILWLAQQFFRMYLWRQYW